MTLRLTRDPEFCIGFEKELAERLVADPEWSKYFEFRGVDSEDPEVECAAVEVLEAADVSALKIVEQVEVQAKEVQPEE